MNNFVKGSIAAGAGIVLLMGGAGTFALWNANATVADATIDSGTLTLAADAGVWDEDITMWVPGDEDTYTTTLHIVAVGDNIKAKLAVDEGSFASSSAIDLADALTVDYDVDLSDPDNAGVVQLPDGSYKIVEGSYDIPVVVTVEFPENSVDELVAQNQSATIEDIGFTLNQVISF
jgi:alternate signal-mediated exported protein